MCDDKAREVCNTNICGTRVSASKNETVDCVKNKLQNRFKHHHKNKSLEKS
jgi:hypothetical protein